MGCAPSGNGQAFLITADLKASRSSEASKLEARSNGSSNRNCSVGGLGLNRKVSNSTV